MLKESLAMDNLGRASIDFVDSEKLKLLGKRFLERNSILQ